VLMLLIMLSGTLVPGGTTKSSGASGLGGASWAVRAKTAANAMDAKRIDISRTLLKLKKLVSSLV
jgi:hypothetical protein